MRVLFHAAIATACFALSAPNVSYAHGGTYLGPGDLVPPGGSGGGGGGNPVTPGSSGNAPGGPSSGAPIPGAPPTGGQNGGPGSSVQTGGYDVVDMTDWSFWWEFNKAPYINLKASLLRSPVETGTPDWFIGQGEYHQGGQSQHPTRAEIEAVVVPALTKALEHETNNDIVTACIMALAKIGEEADESGESRFAPIIGGYLADSNQEISETAALALGILAEEAGVAPLREIYLDTKQGRQLVGRGEVPIRTRAFAAYALGLCASKLANETLKVEIVEALSEVLDGESSSTRDIHVATVIALGMVRFERTGTDSAGGDPERIDARLELVDYLVDFLEGDAHSLVRAHAPIAIARLLTGQTDEAFVLRREAVAAHFVRIIDAKKQRNEILQSCVQALGELGDADPSGIDADIRRCLADADKAIADKQTGYFAMIALAQVAGRPGQQSSHAGIKDAQRYLLAQLAKGKGQDRAWASISAGVLCNAISDVPVDIFGALKMELEGERTPRVGAYAIAAALTQDESFIEPIMAKLDRINDDTARGNMCLSLGMLGAREATDQLRAIVEESTYRPDLLRQAAIGLGLLGDPDAVEGLTKRLVDTRSLASQAALSAALGMIGDKRSLEPLVNMLENQEHTERARAFAAVALGLIGDEDLLPWNSAMSLNLNYTANTETLNSNSAGTGVLNIL